MSSAKMRPASAKVESLRQTRISMPVLSKGGDELFLGAKRDKVVYGASMSSKTSLVEALTSQSSKISDLIVITDSVEPGADVNKPDWDVMTRVRRKTKVSIRPTSDLLLAGKPMQFCPVKMKALFAGKKRWTYIVLGDWERHLPYTESERSRSSTTSRGSSPPLQGEMLHSS